MAMFRVTVHLSDGGQAEFQEEANAATLIDSRLTNELTVPDPRFKVNSKLAIVNVARDRVIGWTIEQA
ncbi:MAG: hypothetical protein QM775_33130 [Pirellulales bacterium]